jgi:hypothetical protein
MNIHHKLRSFDGVELLRPRRVHESSTAFDTYVLQIFSRTEGDREAVQTAAIVQNEFF